MTKSLLGDFPIQSKTFSNLKKIFKGFERPSFKKLNKFEKIIRISEKLCFLIEKEKDPAFLFFPVLNFIKLVQRKKILPGYNFSLFELWLNQYSDFDLKKNKYVRAKIAGRYIPRNEYQKFFPIGMEKMYDGTHFVTAHKSPDLDAVIASFWGWMDAFAARVGTHLHVWNVPGGLPKTYVETRLLFENIFGRPIFDLVKNKSVLTLNSLDIITQDGIIKKNKFEHTIDVANRQRSKAVIIIDKDSNYIGDWRSVDVEGVRQIIMLLNNCLRWFENNFHINLISFFAEKGVQIKLIPAFIEKIFKIKIKNCHPVMEYNDVQKKFLNDYLEKVLMIKKGLDATFEEFAKSLKNNRLVLFHKFYEIFAEFQKSGLFNKKGFLIENRVQIFLYLEKIINNLNLALKEITNFIEEIDVALQIKRKVFGYLPHFISPKSDIEEIKMKLGARDYLTVNVSSQNNYIPIGIVKAIDVRKHFLGTVSFRDFCNSEEIKLAPYLQIISVVDHHKINLKTYTPSSTVISDAQSTNTMMAEINMSINDEYSLGNMSRTNILGQIKKTKDTKILAKLLKKKEILEKKHEYYVHPQREFIEYLHYLFGILDDSDLLMKVTKRDVVCLASLLNRLKSIAGKKQIDIIDLDSIAKDENFLKNASQKILRNKDMYSLYSKIYKEKEKEINKNILLCVQDKEPNFFLDVKEQNGCVRIGQSKMFLQNIKTYQKHVGNLRKKWLACSKNTYENKPEYDLHLHMISTIRGADEVYKGLLEKYKHKDEMWIWIASTDLAVEHLKSFLASFSSAKEVIDNNMSIVFLSKKSQLLQQIFQESFIKVPCKIIDKQMDMAILYYNAGSINSRKAMISPYLPNITD